MLRNALFKALCEPKLQALWIKVRDELDDVEESDVGDGDDGGSMNPLFARSEVIWLASAAVTQSVGWPLESGVRRL